MARACRDRGLEPLVLAPRRLEPLARWAGIAHLAPPAEPPRAEALRDWVRAALAGFAPRVLGVDVFPRGILGELREDLEELAPLRVLVTRHGDPRFYASTGMGEALVRYHRVLATEPPAPALAGHPGLRRLPPIVLVGADELEPPGREPRWEVLDLTGPRRVLPAAPVLRRADRVVAHAGYASYYELEQAGVPAVLLPLPRALDDQFARARGELGLPLRAPCEVVSSPEQVPGALARLAGARPAEPRDLGGAARAAAEIADLLG